MRCFIFSGASLRAYPTYRDRLLVPSSLGWLPNSHRYFRLNCDGLS
jgi:hypothetical protein